MAQSRAKFKVVEVQLDPKEGEDAVHGSVPYETEADARAAAERSAQSYPEREFNPADNSWLVKGHDGRRIWIYVDTEDA